MVEETTIGSIRMKGLCEKLNGKWDDTLYECRVPYWAYTEDFWEKNEDLIKSEITKMTKIEDVRLHRPSLVVETGHLIGRNKEEVEIIPNYYGIVEICGKAYGDGISYKYVDFKNTRWREISSTCTINGKEVSGTGGLEDIWEAETIAGYGNVCIKLYSEVFEERNLNELVMDVQDCAKEIALFAEDRLIRYKRIE